MTPAPFSADRGEDLARAARHQLAVEPDLVAVDLRHARRREGEGGEVARREQVGAQHQLRAAGREEVGEDPVDAARRQGEDGAPRAVRGHLGVQVLEARDVAADDDQVHPLVVLDVERGDRPAVRAGDGERVLGGAAGLERASRRGRACSRTGWRPGRRRSRRRRSRARGRRRRGRRSRAPSCRWRRGPVADGGTRGAGAPTADPTPQAAPNATASTAAYPVSLTAVRIPSSSVTDPSSRPTTRTAPAIDTPLLRKHTSGGYTERFASRGGRRASNGVMIERCPPSPLASPARSPPGPCSAAVPLADSASLAAADPHRTPWPGREIESGGVTLHVRETPSPAGPTA